MDLAEDATVIEEIVVDTKETTSESLITEDQATQGQAEVETDSELVTDQLTDEAVLEKIAQQGKSNEDYILAQQLLRNDNLSKQTDMLMTIITDSEQNTEAVSKAYDDLQVIQTQTAKLNDIEDILGKDFPNVIVTQASDKWKVVVQNDNLERSQAVSIIDLVTKELNIGAGSISIQTIPQKN